MQNLFWEKETACLFLPKMRKNAMRILLVCVNLALTAVYAVLLLRL